MLDPEDVDEGFFTPVASASLANIFRDDSANDETANASLKYKAPQPNKTEQSARTDESSATQCIFSCSLIAYEWIKGAHQCKGKVGFAIMQIISTGRCKIILYSPDKSTLSCTSISPELKVTVKGVMISLFDDHKKYWGLCFNDKVIDKVKVILQEENVIINDFETSKQSEEPVKPDIENVECGTDLGVATNFVNEKALILSRIANVGHAILPTSSSPTKKITTIDRLSPTVAVNINSVEKLHALTDENSTSSSDMSVQDLTRSVAVQAGQSINTAHDSKSLSTNTNQLCVQHSITSVPFVNNQVFTYMNGCMVPVQMHVPVMSYAECGISSADVEGIIHKLTRLQNLVKSMEILESDTETSKQTQSQELLTKISDLEELITEKENMILSQQSDLKNQQDNYSEIVKKQNIYISSLEKQLVHLKEYLIAKDEQISNMILRSEANNLLASMVKKLMNDTFRSLASNFESEVSYSGNDIKSILATVIKKCTVESFKDLNEQQ